MKIAGKIAILSVCLCVVAAAASIGLYLVHRNYAPGNYGRNLEFRLAAFNLDSVDLPMRPSGHDALAGDAARSSSESGETPAGFIWLPIWKPFAAETDGNLGLISITRVSGGREFLLVADRPEMMLNHAANVPAWGVKSVQLRTSNQFGRAFPYVEIALDHSGQKLLRQFTQKYRHHSIAIIVDGQVCLSEMLLTPLEKGVLGISFPPGRQSEAEKLRDALLSAKG